MIPKKIIKIEPRHRHRRAVPRACERLLAQGHHPPSSTSSTR